MSNLLKVLDVPVFVPVFVLKVMDVPFFAKSYGCLFFVFCFFVFVFVVIKSSYISSIIEVWNHHSLSKPLRP